MERRRSSESHALAAFTGLAPAAALRHFAWNLSADLLHPSSSVPVVVVSPSPPSSFSLPPISSSSPSSSSSSSSTRIIPIEEGDDSSGKTMRSFEGLATTTSPVAIVVLNHVLSWDALRAVWDQASWRICADGGANRLLDLATSYHRADKFIPDVILGDLDSLRPDVRQFYEQHGAKLVVDRDQSTTDFEKVLSYLQQIETNLKMTTTHSVLALGALDGRFDHTMRSVHSILKELEKRRVYLMNTESVVFALPPGKHAIHVNTDVEGPSFGLFPILGDAIVTTNGLQWDIGTQKMGLGTFVSSSNRLKDRDTPMKHRLVEVSTTAPLLWTSSCHLGRDVPVNLDDANIIPSPSLRK